MPLSRSTNRSRFILASGRGTLTVTVDPRLAHQVLRTRLIPTAYKRDCLAHAHMSPSTAVVDYARESELFYDIMLELGVLSIQSIDAIPALNRESEPR